MNASNDAWRDEETEPIPTDLVEAVDAAGDQFVRDVAGARPIAFGELPAWMVHRLNRTIRGRGRAGALCAMDALWKAAQLPFAPWRNFGAVADDGGCVFVCEPCVDSLDVQQLESWVSAVARILRCSFSITPGESRPSPVYRVEFRLPSQNASIERVQP